MTAGKRYNPTCQTCGKWFRTSAGAIMHLVANPKHGPVK